MLCCDRKLARLLTVCARICGEERDERCAGRVAEKRNAARVDVQRFRVR